MSRLVGDANPDVALIQSDTRYCPVWYRDRSADYVEGFDHDKVWSRGRLDGDSGAGVGSFVEALWFEPPEFFGGTHTGFVITSDQLTVDLCEAATNWATIGTWTTAPVTIDDNRLEGSLALQGRNSNAQGWTHVLMPGATAVWQYQASPTSYVDITTAFNNATITDTNPWPASEIAGDQMLIGWPIQFGGLSITIATAGIGGTLTWKYWNGSTWTALSGVTDGTTGLTAAAGTYSVTWTMPSDWTAVSLNSSTKLFYIAAEVATTYSTNPVLTQGFLMYAGNGDYNFYIWVNNPCHASTDTWARGGFRISVSSDLTPTLSGTWPTSGATNSRQWYLDGSDGLRVGGYVPYVCDPSAIGSLDIGSLLNTQIRRVGFAIGTTSTIATATRNIFWDAVRIGSGLIHHNGSAEGSIAFADDLKTDHTINTMYGIVTQVGGVYYLGGKLYIGESDQTTATYFADASQVVIYRNFPVATKFYEIKIVGNNEFTSTFQVGTYLNGLTSGGCTIKGASRTNANDPSPVFSVWTLTASQAAAVALLYGSNFSELYRATLNSAAVVRSCTFTNFGDITASGALFDSCTFQDLNNGSPILATYAVKIQTQTATVTNCKFINCATAILWDRNADTGGRLDNTSFRSGGTGHAIELGTNVPSAITLTSVTFVGYGADTTTNAAIYNNSGKSVTITVVGGTTPTVRNGAGASTTIINNVTVTLTGLQNPSEVRVFLAGTQTEVSGTGNENVTSGAHAFNITASTSVDISILALAYQDMRILAYSTASSATIPVSQVIDRQYNNPV